jgi:hypothetical protein
MDMSEVILNSVPKRNTHTNNGVRTSAEQEIRVAKLFIAILVSYCMWVRRGEGQYT